MIEDKELHAYLDMLVALPAFRSKWKAVRKRLFLLYLPYLSNPDASEIFGFTLNTTSHYRSEYQLDSYINIWEHPPPPIDPRKVIVAAKMYITGYLFLHQIAKKLDVPLHDLAGLLKSPTYNLEVQSCMK